MLMKNNVMKTEEYYVVKTLLVDTNVVPLKMTVKITPNLSGDTPKNGKLVKTKS